MFNRRFLRIKVLQGMYAHFQSEKGGLHKSIKELHHSIERGFDLFLFLLSLPVELDERNNRFIQDTERSGSDGFQNSAIHLKFSKNKILSSLRDSAMFQKHLKDRKILWGDMGDQIVKTARKLRQWDVYLEYCSVDESTYKEDRDFLVRFYREFVADSELLSHSFQEKSIYWDDENYSYTIYLITGVLKKLNENKKIDDLVTSAYDNPDDKEFVETLFRKTIEKNEEFKDKIMSKTTNWDEDRIAMMDMLLMKMALAEITTFKMIPVKVSMNEYIDIAKSFSSPRSAQFINGILDKVVAEMKTEKSIKKVGRGLIE